MGKKEYENPSVSVDVTGEDIQTGSVGPVFVAAAAVVVYAGAVWSVGAVVNYAGLANAYAAVLVSKVFWPK